MDEEELKEKIENKIFDTDDYEFWADEDNPYAVNKPQPKIKENPGL